MKISFIIPVYNCKQYLSGCVESIQKSGAQNYEILLIDDGSSDGSGDLCDVLAGQDSRIRAIHQTNAGVSAARNKGISEALGSYVLFVDADDTLLPFSGEIFRLLDEGVDMLIYGMEFRYFHRDQYVRKEIKAVDSTIRINLAELSAQFSELFYRNYFAPVWNKFIRRAMLEDYNLRFDHRLTNYEDLAFTLQALSAASDIAAVPDVNYVYRVDYDHDKTVDRIAAIDDIMGNTDIIAEMFLGLEQAMQAAGASTTEQIRDCLRNIYFEIFSVKMKTTALGAVKRYCRDFMNDGYVMACVERVGIEPGNQERMYNWILRGNSLAIWLRTRYSMLRHFVARNIKRITGWRLS